MIYKYEIEEMNALNKEAHKKAEMLGIDEKATKLTEQVTENLDKKFDSDKGIITKFIYNTIVAEALARPGKESQFLDEISPSSKDIAQQNPADITKSLKNVGNQAMRPDLDIAVDKVMENYKPIFNTETARNNARTQIKEGLEKGSDAFTNPKQKEAYFNAVSENATGNTRSVTTLLNNATQRGNQAAQSYKPPLPTRNAPTSPPSNQVNTPQQEEHVEGNEVDNLVNKANQEIDNNDKTINELQEEVNAQQSSVNQDINEQNTLAEQVGNKISASNVSEEKQKQLNEELAALKQEEQLNSKQTLNVESFEVSQPKTIEEVNSPNPKEIEFAEAKMPPPHKAVEVNQPSKTKEEEKAPNTREQDLEALEKIIKEEAKEGKISEEQEEEEFIDEQEEIEAKHSPSQHQAQEENVQNTPSNSLVPPPSLAVENKKLAEDVQKIQNANAKEQEKKSGPTPLNSQVGEGIPKGKEEKGKKNDEISVDTNVTDKENKEKVGKPFEFDVAHGKKTITHTATALNDPEKPGHYSMDIKPSLTAANREAGMKAMFEKMGVDMKDVKVTKDKDGNPVYELNAKASKAFREAVGLTDSTQMKEQGKEEGKGQDTPKLPEKPQGIEDRYKNQATDVDQAQTNSVNKKVLPQVPKPPQQSNTQGVAQNTLDTTTKDKELDTTAKNSPNAQKETNKPLNFNNAQQRGGMNGQRSGGLHGSYAGDLITSSKNSGIKIENMKEGEKATRQTTGMDTAKIEQNKSQEK